MRFFILIITLLPVYALAWPHGDGFVSWGGNSGHLCKALFDGEGGSDVRFSALELKYNTEGHFNTSHLLAQLAGFGSYDAALLGCYTEFPDVDNWRLNAIYVSVWGLARLQYRHRITADLHSLHGGNAEKVALRREELGKLLSRTFEDKEPVWKLGFIAHAYGDAYAHVYEKDGKEHAYCELFGHLFDGHTPDEIAHGNNIDRYEQYVRSLYELYKGISKAEGSDTILESFVAGVREKASTGNNDAVIRYIQTFDGTPEQPGQTSFFQLPDNPYLETSEISAFLKHLDKSVTKASRGLLCCYRDN